MAILFRMIALPSLLAEGVPTGALEPMPSSFQWPQASPEPPSAQSDLELVHCQDNWLAAEQDPACVQRLVDEEVAQGFIALFHGTLEQAQQAWPLGTAVGKLNLVKVPGKDPRLVLDSAVCVIAILVATRPSMSPCPALTMFGAASCLRTNMAPGLASASILKPRANA